MTKLSVNINKIATLRNARGANVPDVVQVARDCEKFCAQGITVHPRPDERHITRKDVFDLKKVVTTEFNIEGNPTEEFISLVISVKPEQVTLVPDAPDNITSNAGWDTIRHRDFLTRVTKLFKDAGIRVSIFVDPVEDMVEGAALCGADRVELYTEMYAREYPKDRQKAIDPYIKAAVTAHKAGLGINAGHDLSLENIEFFTKNIEHLQEVSIGHALICESLYLGLENTIGSYLNKIKRASL